MQVQARPEETGAFIPHFPSAGGLPLLGVTLDDAGKSLTSGDGGRLVPRSRHGGYVSEETNPERIAYRTRPATS
jgi:hypothetical protein